jgi:hypothetical protein
MKALVYLLIVIMTYIIVANYLPNISTFRVNVEGLTNNDTQSTSYQSYPKDDVFILAQKNAANIEFLKDKYDNIQNLENMIFDLSRNVALNTANISEIAKQIANASQQLVGRTPGDTSPPPQATGL